MEEESYKTIVEKALSMGHVILCEEKIGGKPGAWEYEYHWCEKMPDFSLFKRHYFYNPAYGGFVNVLKEPKVVGWKGNEPQLVWEGNDAPLTWAQIKKEKLGLGCIFAPMIETACSRVLKEDKVISSTRLYVQSDYYDSQGILIKQSDVFMNQYSALTRAVKKLAVKRELTCKPPYSDCIRKEYMTDYLFSLYQDGYELR